MLTLVAHPTLAPVAPKRRITALDSLRGFALLGVLVVNVYQAYSTVLSPADAQVVKYIRVLGEGTFYPIFSLLFGLGFALQLAKGEAALPVFRRRLGFLLLFGLIHGVFIWDGDILASYAVVGFLLPLIYRWSRWQLVILAVIGWVSAFLLLSPFIDDAFDQLDHTELYATGTYWAATRLRAIDFGINFIGGLLLFSGLLVALFLLGYMVGRRGVADAMGNRRWLWGVLLVSSSVALPLLFAYNQDIGLGIPQAWWFVIEYLVASPFLGFAYLAGLSLFMLIPLGAAVMSPFSYVGRMALSNYLGQSVVCTLIFYGYGLGLLGELGAQTTLFISLTLFAGQMVFSYLWLRMFRYGPMEWLWRSLTYGQSQPIRPTTSPSPALDAPPQSDY